MLNRAKKALHNRSLRQRVIGLLIIILLFFGLIFVLSSILIRNRAEQDYLNRTSETAVNNVVSTISSSIDQYNYITRLIMVNENVVDFLTSNAADRNYLYEARMGMYEIMSMYSNIIHIESVYVFRLDRQFVNTGKADYIINFDSPEWARIFSARGGKVLSINGNGLIRKSDGSPSLTIARAIYDINSQKLIGSLVMNVSYDCFDDVMKLQQTDGICIVDKYGTYLSGDEVLADAYSKYFYKENLVSQKMKLSGDKYTVTGMAADEPLVVMCKYGKGESVIPTETVFAFLLTLFGFLISTFMVIWFIGTNITQPITKLDEAMERTKSSGWLKKIDEKMPNNELGRLAESYNSMIEYLNELFDKLLKEEENIRKAEMRVLHEQIKPHFLYNSLETISYLAYEEKAEKARDALETLGSFYRNFLSKGNREITFEKELKITKDYLSLQKLRYGDCFEDEYVIDDDTLSCMVPKLILQPLVENCIYHGVRLKGEQCIIRISAYNDEKGLHILVYDSGVGMSEEAIKKVLSGDEVEEDPEAVKTSQGGFGLKGTLDRIRYYCNNDDIVTIRSEEGEYTEIQLLIPNRREDAEKGGC